MNDYEKTYQSFQTITGYDIKAFFQSFLSFVTTYYPYIVNYYNTGVINREAFFELENLSREIEKIEPLFVLHKNTLSDIGMWFLLDTFTEIQTKVNTIRMSAKWMRSVYTSVRSNTIKVQKILNTGQNFEDVAMDLESLNPQDDWLNIVTPEYIREEDYSVDRGPSIFSVNLQNIGLNYVDNVVAPLSGKSVLGIDIDTSFSFEEDDIKTVVYDDSMTQALKIIMEALKGCIPEFPDYGLPNEYIGTTVNAFQYATVFKAIMNMFQRDSRWKTVELLDIVREEDSIFLKIKATAVSESDYLVTVPI